MPLNWNDLRIFLALARAQTLLAAGEALTLDPATVGRRVAALEAALGERLFDRSPRGYALTEAGRQLMEPAERMESAAAATVDFGARPQGVSGTVRVGAPGGVAHQVLSPALVNLAARHADLRLELVALPRIFSLSKREADLALALTPPTAGRLTVRRIADYRLHLYAHDDLIARHGLTRLRDLSEVRFIGYVSDLIFDKELDYLPLISAGVKPQLTCTALMIQARWIADSAGVGVLPDFIGAPLPGVSRVLEDEVAFTRAFHLIRHEDDLRVARISRAADAIVDAVRTAVAD